MQTTYQSLLERPEWHEKRKTILRRDKHRCFICGAKNRLHVHHLKYYANRMPWEYDNILLLTLCENCHVKQHQYDSVILDAIWLWRIVIKLKKLFRC